MDEDNYDFARELRGDDIDEKEKDYILYQRYRIVILAVIVILFATVVAMR